MEITGTDDDAVRADLDTEEAEPGLAVVEVIAEIEDVDGTELSPIYDCVDHVLDHVFSSPPSPEADIEVSFDYEGYRVTVRQDGTATFVPKMASG